MQSKVDWHLIAKAFQFVWFLVDLVALKCAKIDGGSRDRDLYQLARSLLLESEMSTVTFGGQPVRRIMQVCPQCSHRVRC